MNKLLKANLFGADMKGFPYNFEKFIGTNYGAISTSPFGNTLTKEMAIAAINGERIRER